MALTEKLKAIADKLRYYTGNTKTLKLEEMVDEIDGILSAITNDKTRGRWLYAYCRTITEIPRILDTSNVRDFYGMCHYCNELVTVPPIDTSKAEDFTNFFNTCRKLVTIEGNLDATNIVLANRLNNMFSNCTELQNVRFVGTINISGLSVLQSTKLTHDSLMSIVNALCDNSGSDTPLTVTFGSTNLAKLTDDELSIMDEKNWSYS